MKKLNWYSMAFAAVFLTACESEPSENLQGSLAGSTVDANAIAATLAINATSQAVGNGSTAQLYDPSIGVVPSSIDLLFNGTLDGTLNIPIVAGDPTAALKTVLNALDGFSTNTPISTQFSAAIDSGTITPTAVRMFEVTLSGFARAVVSMTAELTFGVDFVATLSSIDPTNSTLAVVPLKPLKPDTAYYVVITNSLKDMSGDSVKSSNIYALLKGSTPHVNSAGVSQLPGVPDANAATLETLRQLISASEFAVDFALTDLAAINIVGSWSFTTQSVGRTLTTARSMVGTPATNISASNVNLGMGAGVSLAGAANVFEGSLTLPYYLTAPSAGDPTAILTKPWQSAIAVGGENNLTRLNSLPAVTNAALEVPLLITTPVNPAFSPPWKTVIFQHGITTNRAVMLTVADALANAGFATVAMDMPLHGVDTGDNFAAFRQAGKERTFEVDYVTQDANDNITAAAPDTIVDSSGRHFINLSNLLVTRDNVRQAIVDLFALTAAIPTIDVNGGGADLDGSNIYFVGHSLGAMVGTTFLALEPAVKDAVLAFGGAGYAKILDGSATFSPSIVAGLVAASGGAIDKNAVGAARGAYESFIGVAQTAVDTADPVNHAAAAVNGRGMLFFEIAGNGTPGTSDLVVPNTVPDGNDASSTVPAPLAGTEPLLALMGLTQVNSTQAGSDLKLSVKFTEGSHSSLLNPAPAINPSAAVTTEIQTQMASFLAADGNALPVTNIGIIQVP